jgi:aminopeptidase
MRDPRVERLGELIVSYSLGLEAGQILRIDVPPVAAPLAIELYRAALAAGGHPYASVELEQLPELLVKKGNDEQLEFLSPIAAAEIEFVDAIVTIWSESNTRALSRVPPDRHQRLIASSRKIAKRRWERIAAGELNWCGVVFPTTAHAQDAEMSLEEYEHFVLRACHVEGSEDPVTHWNGVREELHRRAEALSEAREIRILGPDTDLRLGVEGRRWEAADGRYNMPDGEVYTSPLEATTEGEIRILGPDTDLRLGVEGRRWEAADGRYNMPDGEVYTSPLEATTEGEIRFTFPALFRGREVEDIRLRFEGGKIVGAEAARGQEFLEALLDVDEGARRLGEVAFGLNYEIDRFTNNTLFDEKIGGTMHVALGSAFEELGGQNTSALHWDLVCDLRADGEVYADGALVWRAGRFLEPAIERV